MKLAILTCLVGASAAFAPTHSQVGVTTSLKADVVVEEESTPVRMSEALPFLPYPTNLEGYVGDVGFDPLRVSDYFPMDYLREAEIKHGRISMLAFAGFFGVGSGFRIYPLPEEYEGLNPITAHDKLVEQGAMGQIFLFVAILEMLSWLSVAGMLQGSGRKPGDFGFDPLQFGKDPEQKKILQLQEIKNGRLAMLAFGGLVTQGVLTGGEGFPYAGF